MRKILFFVFGVLPLNLLAQGSIASTFEPTHQDTINTSHPLLIWNFSPTFQWDDRTHLMLKVCKINVNQDDQAAIVSNAPLYYVQLGNVNTHMYPFNAPELEEGHSYVWRIEVYNSNVLIGNSNVSRFTLPIEQNPVQFAALSKNYTGAVYSARQGKFYFSYSVLDRAGDVSYRIENEKGIKVQGSCFNVKNGNRSDDFVEYAHLGENRYLLDLPRNLQPGVYRLIVEDEKNRIQKLRFKVQ